jgi:restriction endonuclease S subunit
MTEGGDADKLGRGYVWEGQIPGCLHQNHIFAVRPDKPRLEPRYLAFVMTSEYGRDYFTRTAHQTTNLASTNSTKVGNFPVPLPPLVEQNAIIDELTRRLEDADQTMQTIEAQLAKLRDYRQAVITAAVTGKLDLRQKTAV